MQGVIIPFTDTHIPTANAAKEGNTKLQAYLQRICWDTTTFTNARLACMLAASCLRYLEGIADLYFVIGLAQEIHRKYRKTMKLSLWYSYEILNDIGEKLRTKSILPTDQEVIRELVNDAQEVITKRRYQSESILQRAIDK